MTRSVGVRRAQVGCPRCGRCFSSIPYSVWIVRGGLSQDGSGPRQKRRKRMLRFAWGGPAVLVAVSDERRPEQIARALARVGLIPVLAFDEHELRAFMRSASFAGIVIDAAIDPEGAAVAPFAGRRDVVLLLPRAREPSTGTAPRACGAARPTSRRSSSRHGCGRCSSCVPPTCSTASWPGAGSSSTCAAGRRASTATSSTSRRCSSASLPRSCAPRSGVLTKEELQAEAWPLSVPDDGERLVAHIRRIRAKLEPDPSRPRFLLTARG